MTTTSTTLPKQLQKQIEDAKALMGNAPQETPDGNTVQTTPAPTSEVNSTETGNTVPTTPDATVIQSPEPEVTPQPAPAHQPSQDEDTWQHKYNVLHGKYNADIRRMQSQVSDLTTQLNAQHHTPTQAPSQAPANQPQVIRPQANVSEITDDLVRQTVSEDMIDEWGLDYWKQVLKVQQSFQPTSTTPGNAVDQRLMQLETRGFYSELASMVPDLAQLDQDEQFIDWLQDVEPLSGRTYHSFLQDAESQGDSIRAAAIFDQYKSNSGRPTAPAPAKKPSAQLPSVSSQVAPSGHPTTVQPAGATMSLTEWSKQKASVGRMAPTNPVLAGQLKKQLDTAMSQGRVLDAEGKSVVKTA